MSIKQLEPLVKDIGDFEVRRLLPSLEQRAVGPFVFWDHFGPVTLPADRNMDVRPHPHIGLATLTWLFEGQIMHRDSLGHTQAIQPGSVNWMTAGRGIVHSERTPEALRGQEKPLHGLQIWLGLPEADEETDPDFQHYPAAAIPSLVIDGVSMDLIAGKAMGQESPVAVYSPLCYLAIEMQPGQAFEWERHYEEEAVYLVSGSLTLNDSAVALHHMAMLPAGDRIRIASEEGAVLALLGGEPLGRRHLSWNFVSSDPEKLKAAAKRWDDGGFDRVPGDDEFIPLPDHLKP